jgi:hypothetical protein
MTLYEIRAQKHLDQPWSTWFDGLTTSYASDDITVCMRCRSKCAN